MKFLSDLKGHLRLSDLSFKCPILEEKYQEYVYPTAKLIDTLMSYVFLAFELTIIPYRIFNILFNLLNEEGAVFDYYVLLFNGIVGLMSLLNIYIIPQRKLKFVRGIPILLCASIFIINTNVDIIKSSLLMPQFFLVFVSLVIGGLLVFYKWTISCLVYIMVFGYLCIRMEWTLKTARIYHYLYGIAVAYLCVINYFFEYFKRKIFLITFQNEREKDFLQNLFQSLPDGILISRQGEIVFYNQSLLEFLEIDSLIPNFNTKEAIYSKLSSTVNTKGISLGTLILESLSSPPSLNSCFFNCSQLHHFRNFEVKFLPVYFDGILCQALILKDISMMKQIRIEKSENKYFNYLIGSFSQELNTPLNGVVGIIELLKTSTDKAVQSIIPIATKCLNVLINKMGAFVDLCLIEQNKFSFKEENVSILKLIDNSMKTVALKIKTRNVELYTRIKKDFPKCVATDKKRLEEVLVLLLENSATFTFSGYISLTALIVNDFLKFKVEDTGLPLKEIDQENLIQFKPPKESDPCLMERRGIFLRISSKIIQSLGGKLKYKKIENKQQFLLSIPVKPCNFHESKKNLYENNENTYTLYNTSSPFPSMESIVLLNTPVCVDMAESFKIPLANVQSILIVDDDSNNVYVLRSLLEQKFGFSNIYVAENGKEALDLVDQMKSTGVNFDLIFMDVNMPIMDGCLATCHIRRSRNNSSIIGTTANEDKLCRERCTNAGMNKVLNKPITIQKLRTLFE